MPDPFPTHARFDEGGLATIPTARSLRNRQTKGAETDRLGLQDRNASFLLYLDCHLLQINILPVDHGDRIQGNSCRQPDDHPFHEKNTRFSRPAGILVENHIVYVYFPLSLSYYVVAFDKLLCLNN